MVKFNLVGTSLLLISLLSLPIFAQNITPKYEVVIHSLQPYMLFYKISFHPKTSYLPGEKITIPIYLKNIGDKSIPTLYIIADLSEGCNKTNTNCYNLFYEKKVTTSLDFGENKTIYLNITLPSNLRAGNYTLSLYIRSPRYDIFGIHPSYQPMKQYSFFVNGKGNFPKAKILPEKTDFAMATAQRGPTIYKNVSVEGYFAAQNLLDKEFKGKVKLYVCPFDDQGYFSCNYLKEYSISIPPKGKKDFVYEIRTNQEPDAYSLRFELVDEQGNINSIWKSRYIINGEDAPILALAPERLNYKAGENVSVFVYVTGPFYPSHVKEVNDVNIKVSAYKGGKEIFTKTKTGNFKQESVNKLEFNFVTPEDMNNYKLCAQTFKDGKKLDEICHFISKEKEEVKTEERPSEAKTKAWVYIVAIVLLIIIGILIYKTKRK